LGRLPGDAITDQAFVIQRWLREAGFQSEIYAESIHPSLFGKVKPYRIIALPEPSELVILHHSIGSDLVDHLLAQNVRFLDHLSQRNSSSFFSAF
jgi:hypothetical protein